MQKSERLFHHLWVILLDPEPSGKTIMVNLTSRKPQIEQDLTVVLHPGDHPYVTQESIVNYSDARFIEDVRLIEQSFQMRVGIPRERCSESLLRRIQEGLLKSAHPDQGIQTYFRARIGK
jgi:hypothetical protein